MARFHGKDARVYLGARDVSGDLISVDAKANAQTHDATTFASNDWIEHDPGLASWEASVEAFHQSNSGASASSIGRQFEDLLGTTGGVLSVYVGDADAVGDNGFLFSDAILTERGNPISVADLVKITGSLKPTSSSTKPGLRGVLLHPKATESATANGTSHDNGASSANGGRISFHTLAVTGTGGTLKVQHSVDNVTFADLGSAVAASAAGASTQEVTGTINRYTRVVHTINATSSVEYVGGLARY